MFRNADSGVYLTQYRAYDPVAGRWLSRDPLGEGTDPVANLYAYVGGNPLSYIIDPDGLLTLYDDGTIKIQAFPNPPAGGNEHARQGPGGAYPVHVQDSEGNSVRMNTENWTPLTPKDKEAYKKSRNIKTFCESLSEPPARPDAGSQDPPCDRRRDCLQHRGRAIVAMGDTACPVAGPGRAGAERPRRRGPHLDKSAPSLKKPRGPERIL
jgi:RHS repeat-associated protein